MLWVELVFEVVGADAALWFLVCRSPCGVCSPLGLRPIPSNGMIWIK